MTNYEWLIKNYEKLVKNILSRHLGKVTGVPASCLKTDCINCDFESKTHFPCSVKVKEWLDEEHMPFYKKGDIVVTSSNQLRVVRKVDPGEQTIAVSSYIDCDEYASTIPVTDIKQRVGYVDERRIKNDINGE